MKRLLSALGFPTTNAQGHEIGCLCAECMAARDKREPFKPGTVGALIEEAIRQRREGARFCTCGVSPGPAFAPDPRVAWRHMSHCPHARGTERK